MRTFLLWMKRKRLVLEDPLAGVRKIVNPQAGSFRRTLSVAKAQRLLTKSPRHRALVYLTLIYTGLRRAELNGLKWDGFDFTVTPTRLRVLSHSPKIARNRPISYALR